MLFSPTNNQKIDERGFGSSTPKNTNNCCFLFGCEFLQILLFGRYQNIWLNNQQQNLCHNQTKKKTTWFVVYGFGCSNNNQTNPKLNRKSFGHKWSFCLNFTGISNQKPSWTKVVEEDSLIKEVSKRPLNMESFGNKILISKQP